MTSTKELPLPILREFNKEIVRVWLVGSEQDVGSTCVIDANAFLASGTENAGAGVWGLVLADLARHISSGISKEHMVDKDAVLDDIRKLFNAELEKPTETLTTTRLRNTDRSPGDLDS